MAGDINANLTEIAFILDRSGSMASATEAAITGFNEFLRDQQKAEGQARLTLALVHNEVAVHEAKSSQKHEKRTQQHR